MDLYYWARFENLTCKNLDSGVLDSGELDFARNPADCAGFVDYGVDSGIVDSDVLIGLESILLHGFCIWYKNA